VCILGGCRALIPGTSIKPLDTNLKTLSLKRTVSFVKATKELARHQELMQHVSATTHETEDNDNLSGGDNDIDDEQVSVSCYYTLWQVDMCYAAKHYLSLWLVIHCYWSSAVEPLCLMDNYTCCWRLLKHIRLIGAWRCDVFFATVYKFPCLLTYCSLCHSESDVSTVRSIAIKNVSVKLCDFLLCSVRQQ